MTDNYKGKGDLYYLSPELKGMAGVKVKVTNPTGDDIEFADGVAILGSDVKNFSLRKNMVMSVREPEIIVEL